MQNFFLLLSSLGLQRIKMLTPLVSFNKHIFKGASYSSKNTLQYGSIFLVEIKYDLNPPDVTNFTITKAPTVVIGYCLTGLS